jgi:geranylgeranyl diphosphate synthase type I
MSNQMDAKKSLELLVPRINDVIVSSLKHEKKKSSNILSIVTDLIHNTSEITYGGKRLRGAFVYYGYLMYGGRDLDGILQASALVELTHNYMLVIDDIQDNASLRHGKQTLHKRYENYYNDLILPIRKRKLKKHLEDYEYAGDPEHFGISIGLMGGLLLSHYSQLLFLNSNFDCDLKTKALAKLNRTIVDTAYGQTVDIYGEKVGDVDEEYVLKVHKYKTGKYTYENPLQIGAILAGANDEDLKALSDYGIAGGIAFQIQDDILGMFGDEGKTGKPSDSDLREGKWTLLIVKALENANQRQKRKLLNALGNKNLTREDHEEVKQIIIDTGSLEYSKELALKYVKKAKKALVKNHNPKWNQEGVDFLNGIADYMINREL